MEGSFEHSLNEIVEEHLDLSIFDKRYANDETGRLAYDPRILLKVGGTLSMSTGIVFSIADQGSSTPRRLNNCAT